MRIGERLLLVFSSIILIALMALGIYATWAPEITVTLLAVMYSNLLLQIIVTVLLVLFIVLVFRLMFVGTRKKKNNVFLAATTDRGEIYINVDSISELASRAVKRSDKVRECKVRTVIGNEGANVFVKTSFAPDTVIPEESSLIQTEVKKDIEDLCGIKVQKVVLQIDNSLQQKAN